MDFEQDLRDNLQRQAQALGSGDASLEDIRSTGRRRKAWKAAGGTFGIVAVVGFVVLGISALVSPEEPSPVAESTVVPSEAPVTTGPPPSGPVTTTVPTSTPPATAYPVPIVVETDEQVLAVGTDGSEQVVYAGRYHAVASDGAGGMVFQQQIAIEDQSRDRATIYRVPAGTTEPVALIEQDSGHIVEMFGVEDVDGVPTLLYTDRTGFDSPESAQTMLVAYDLDSGTGRQLAVVGGWESGIRSVSYGGGVYVLESMAESEVWWRYLDDDGKEFEPAFDPHPVCEISADVRCPTQPVMTPEGEILFVRHRFSTPDQEPIDLSAADFVVVNDQGLTVFTGETETVIGDFIEETDLVAWDLSNGRERLLFSVAVEERQPGQDGVTRLGFDYDGRYYVVVVPPMADPAIPTMAIIDSRPPSPVVAVDQVGVPRFPLTPFDLPGTVGSPMG